MTKKIEFHPDFIVVDGNTIPCRYGYVRGEEVSIGAKDHVSIETTLGTLPRDLFFVAADQYKNDKSDKDYSVLEPEHPLFNFARYAAVKSRAAFLRGRLANYKPIPCIEDSPQTVQRDLDRLQNILANDPGQAATEDLAAARTYIHPEERAAYKTDVDRMVEAIFRRW